MHTDPFDTQDVTQDLDQDLLCATARSDERPLCVPRCGAGLDRARRSTFPPDVSGKSSVTSKRAGTMAAGSHSSKKRRNSTVDGAAVSAATIWATGWVLPRLVGPGDHRGLRHRGVLRQRGLDLARLDAEAADLHLEVETAQVLDVAVGQIAGRSPVR